MMATNIYRSVFFLALAVTACSEPNENDLFSERNANVRFAVYRPGAAATAGAPIDTFRLKATSTDTVVLPAVLSTGRTINAVVGFEVSSEQFTADDYVVLGETLQPIDYTLLFGEGVYRREIRLGIPAPLARPGFVAVTLSSCSVSSINLGLPGPRAEGRRFVVEIYED